MPPSRSNKETRRNNGHRVIDRVTTDEILDLFAQQPLVADTDLSGLDEYQRCPRRFMLNRYEQGNRRSPSNGEQAAGFVVHSVLRSALRAHRRGEALSREALDAEIARRLPADLALGARETADEWKGYTARCLNNFLDRLARAPGDLLFVGERLPIDLRFDQDVHQQIAVSFDEVRCLEPGVYQVTEYSTGLTFGTQASIADLRYSSARKLLAADLALREYDPEVTRIVLEEVYLGLGPDVRLTYESTPEDREKAREFLVQQAELVAGDAQEELFAPVPRSIDECLHCAYRAMCPLWTHAAHADAPDDPGAEIVERIRALKQERDEALARTHAVATSGPHDTTIAETAGAARRIGQLLHKASKREEDRIANHKGPRSYSQLRLYRECPSAYGFRYVHKVPVEEQDTSAQLVGQAVHAALDDFHRHRLLGRELREDDVFAFFQEQLTTVWQSASFADGSAPDVEAAIARGRLCLHNYFSTILPNEPAAIQLGREVLVHPRLGTDTDATVDDEEDEELADGHSFIGVIDRVEMIGDGHLRIVDYKTSVPPTLTAEGYPPTDVLDQLAIYAIAVRQRWPEHARRVDLTWHYLGNGNPEVPPRSVQITLSEDALRSIEERTCQTIQAAAEDRSFTPCPGNHCARCSYRSICPAHGNSLRNPYQDLTPAERTNALLQIDQSRRTADRAYQSAKDQALGYAVSNSFDALFSPKHVLRFMARGRGSHIPVQRVSSPQPRPDVTSLGHAIDSE